MDIYPKLIEGVFFIIVFIGISSSYAAGKGVRAASRQIRASATWLYNLDPTKQSCRKPPYHPPIIGIRSNFAKSYVDMLKKIYAIPLIQFIWDAMIFSVIARYIFNLQPINKLYSYLTQEPSYYEFFKLDPKITDDIDSMSAGVIYFPNILFIVWITLLIFGVWAHRDGKWDLLNSRIKSGSALHLSFETNDTRNIQHHCDHLLEDNYSAFQSVTAPQTVYPVAAPYNLPATSPARFCAPPTSSPTQSK